MLALQVCQQFLADRSACRSFSHTFAASHDYTATVGLDREQARALLAAADRDTGAQALRTAAGVRLLLHNALRVDEACALDAGATLRDVQDYAVRLGSWFICGSARGKGVTLPDDETLTWFRVCERRYSLRARSKLTDTSAREQTFDAAMVQFEEMFKAAKTVTEFTRPVQLYYGLAQAGTAIAAAYSSDPWSFSSHGLKLNSRNSPLAAMTIVPDGDGGFQKVAAATGSPVIMGPVSLGALWASIPDLSRAGALPGSDHPVPLRVIARESVPGTPQVHLVLPADMAKTPSELLSALRKVKTIYPGSGDWGIPMEQHAVIPPSAPGLHWQVMMRWLTAGEVTTAKLPEFFDSVAAAYRYCDERYFWPQIGGSAPPSPLMMWWLLLYSFSILARYEPRRWVKMLDPGKSDTAALL